MRRLSLLLLCSLTLAACDQFGSSNHAVDPSQLPPMTGQERALMISADAAAAGGDNETAERNYLTAVGQSQGHVDAHLSLASLYLRENKPDQAKEILIRAVDFQPNHPEVNRLLGKIYVGEDAPQPALDSFNRGLVTAPDNLDLLNGAGIADDMLRKHEAAQAMYRRAMEQNAKEDLSMVKTNLAMSYILDNQPKKAVELLKKDGRQKDASPVMRHNLALAYGMLGRHQQAKTLLKNDMTEEERQQSLKRIHDYIAGDKANQKPAPAQSESQTMAIPDSVLQPVVHEE